MRVGVLQFFSWSRRIPLTTVYGRAFSRIEIMDQTGYDCVWLAEHHFSTYSVCPSINVMATHVAARTRNLRIGMAVSLAAFYNPLRLAEEVALVDVLSGGRVNWGAGRGFDRREFAAFGVKLSERGPRLEEGRGALLEATLLQQLGAAEVQDIGMHVPARKFSAQFVSLVGPSGCGKTTVLKILAGLHDHEGGTVRIGNEAHPFDPARDVGMVFQQPLLLKWRKVLENVLLPAEILGLPMKAARERARGLLEMVGLAGFEDKYPYELSGGMQQRASIARSLVHDPKLILMDEPFGALDALTREKMNLELMRIWLEQKKTIVFVTHGIQEAVFLGSHVAVLTAGPARMAESFAIDLPYPRSLDVKTHEAFGAYTRRIYKLLGME